MYRGFASNVLPLCASAPVGERSSVSCSSELSSSSSHGQSILAAGFSFIGFVTLFLRPLGMGLGSQGLSCTRSRLILCPFRRPLVLFPLRALATTFTWHGCTTRSRPCSRNILPQRWQIVGYLEVDDNFWVSLQVVFRCSRLRVPQGMCAPGLRSHPLSRGFHIMPFTLALALSRSLGVVILMCFLRKVAFQVFSLCPPQLVYTPACWTGARFWFVLVHRISLRHRGAQVPMVRVS